MGGFAFKGLVVATQQPAFARSAPPGRGGRADGAPPPASVHRHDYLRSPTTQGARCARARQGGLQAPAHPADGWPRRQRADPSSLGAPSQERGPTTPSPGLLAQRACPFLRSLLKIENYCSTPGAFPCARFVRFFLVCSGLTLAPARLAQV